MLLDYRSLPTLQRVLIPPFLFALMLMFSFEDSLKAFTSGWAGMMLVLFISQPFAVAEKNRLEALHATMPLTRDDVVKARYLYSVCILAAVMLPPLVLKPFFLQVYEATYFIVAVAFMAVSFAIAVLYPLSFKIGYGKASTIFYISFVLLIIISLFVARSLPQEFLNVFAKLIPATSPGKATAGLLLLFLSYLLSLKIYRTRDL